MVWASGKNLKFVRFCKHIRVSDLSLIGFSQLSRIIIKSNRNSTNDNEKLMIYVLLE